MSERNYDALRLENQLCFPMYACSREVIKRYTPCLQELGLTYTQYVTMLVLWESECVTVKELGRRLYLDSGTLTPLLKKLEAKGFVSRMRSNRDERNLIISVTEQGMALRDRALAVHDYMAAQVDLTGEEAVTLYRLLYKLLDYAERNPV